MKTYHKIQTLFLRDPETNYKRLMPDVWSKPEFEYLQDNLWVVDEKIDGTNIRILWDGIKVEIRGKTDNAQLHFDLYKNLSVMFTPNKMAALFPQEEGKDAPNVCLYGEGCGAGIQKGGGNYSDVKHFKLFDVWVKGIWLERNNVMDVGNRLGCNQAPTIGNMTLKDVIELTKNGFNSYYGDFIAEGIIARPLVEMTNRYGERVITKLKHTDFDHD